MHVYLLAALFWIQMQNLLKEIQKKSTVAFYQGFFASCHNSIWPKFILLILLCKTEQAVYCTHSCFII